MGPKFFHVVLYEYFRVFLNTPFKNSTIKKWKKKTFMVLKLSSQEDPHITKKSSQKWNTDAKMVPKIWFLTIFGSIKNLFWFIFLEPFQEV